MASRSSVVLFLCGGERLHVGTTAEVVLAGVGNDDDASGEDAAVDGRVDVDVFF